MDNNILPFPIRAKDVQVGDYWFFSGRSNRTRITIVKISKRNGRIRFTTQRNNEPAVEEQTWYLPDDTLRNDIRRDIEVTPEELQAAKEGLASWLKNK